MFNVTRPIGYCLAITTILAINIEQEAKADLCRSISVTLDKDGNEKSRTEGPWEPCFNGTVPTHFNKDVEVFRGPSPKGGDKSGPDKNKTSVPAKKYVPAPVGSLRRLSYDTIKFQLTINMLKNLESLAKDKVAMRPGPACELIYLVPTNDRRLLVIDFAAIIKESRIEPTVVTIGYFNTTKYTDLVSVMASGIKRTPFFLFDKAIIAGSDINLEMTAGANSFKNTDWGNWLFNTAKDSAAFCKEVTE